MSTLTANEQALAHQLQPHLYELHVLYYALPMHAFEGTERLIAYGLLLLAEWSTSLQVPALESRRVLLVTYAVQAAIMQYQEARRS